MTSGIVSALNRQITTDVNVTVNMFQIDAAVNSGNSGGPVFNVYGQVIGVVTAKYSQSGMEGLGFAIPIADAASIANDLITNGYVTGKAYLGLKLTTVSASVAKYYNMVQGVYVYSVVSGSCAEAAGLRTGDIITAIDDTQVMTNTQLVQQVKNYRAGDSAVLSVYRDQNYITITVVFDEELPAVQMTDEEAALRSGGEAISQAFRGR
jgi:serine protease Do